ncbi:hypothetical protein Cni_G07180 [Canna indica]|uniref:Uncharacterized protein n=1 Tax=Canna indica TaxID=4628 RepID=A0AAQ3Q5H1_9LILI|nr:hypothetical protein Cni_G07180 [Canna indica]
MQLWQEQLMYKKLQELQGQQKLQQLDQGAREKNSLSHSSALVKPAVCLPRVMNELPINDTLNGMWPNNFVRGMPVTPNHFQKIIAGNTNWAQENGSVAMHNLANGHILTDNQNQGLKSMGFMPNQLDQSLYGMPVSSNRHFANQYSQLFGVSNDTTSIMTKAAVYQAENISDPDPYNNFHSNQGFPQQSSFHDRNSITAQNFQGKVISGTNPVQTFCSGVTLGNFQQENHMQHNLPFQQLHRRQKEDSWSSNLQERPAVQVGISTGPSCLDLTEEKLLFDTDDDNWEASFGGSLNSFMEGYPHGQPSQSEYMGELPSVQSGSWSALMQEAVQASSSDQGVQEEWSGLSFQKTEQSMSKHSDALNDTGWQMASSNDSNLQNASSSTSRPILSYDSDGNPNSYVFPSFQHSFESSHDENNMVPNGTLNVPFHLSTGELNKTQFNQNQEQNQYLQSCIHLQMPVSNGILAGHTFDPKENNSDMQFNSQNVAGRWPRQEMPFSSFNRKHIHGLNAFTTTYQMVPGEGNSHIHETDSNMKKLGASHVNLSSAVQPFKSNIVKSQIQPEGSLMSNFGSVKDSKMISLTKATNQQVADRHNVVLGKDVAHQTCVNSLDNEDMGRTQNQARMRLQTWETSNEDTSGRFSNTCDSNNENAEFFSGEGYASSLSNLVQETNNRVTAKENLTSTGNQNFFPGNQNYSIQSMQGNLVLPTSRNPLSKFQGLANIALQGSRNAVPRYVRNSKFEGHEIMNNPIDVGKRVSNGIKELQHRESIHIHASSGGFDGNHGIPALSSEIKKVSQSRQNIELPHMADRSRDGDRVAQAAADITSSCTHFDHPSTLHSIGWLSPLSQKQPLTNVNVPNSLINQRQHLQKEAGEGAQSLSNSATVGSLPHVTSQLGTWRSISGQEHTRTLGSGQLSLLTDIPYDLNYGGNQLLDRQKQHVSGSNYQYEQQQQREKKVSNFNGHEGLYQTIYHFHGSRDNACRLVNSDVDLREQPVTCNEDAINQSVQTSLFIPSCRVLPSQVAPVPDIRGPAYQPDMNHTKAMNSGFSHVKSPGQHIPVMESTSGFQSSIPGIPQQVGFSKMLHHVWANLSAQQRLAGLQPHKVAPNVLKSTIDQGTHTSSRVQQKVGGQGNGEERNPSKVGTSSVNSQDKDHQVVKSFKSKHPESADSALSGTTFQGQELVKSNLFDGNISGPSLLQHQQDVDRGKSREDSSFHSQVAHAPVINSSSSRSDSVSEYSSIPPEYPSQGYSLLHQIQSIKSSDSDSSMVLGNRMQGADIDSNVYPEQTAGQRIVYTQHTLSNSPPDAKPGTVSQSSFASDVKLLSFVSKETERHGNISSIAEHCDVRSHTHSVSTSSSSSLATANEHYMISPQINSSWFKKFINYKKDMIVAKHDDNSFPRGMENSYIVEQIIDSSKFGTIRQSTSATPITSNKASDLSMFPSVTDHNIVLRTKKRKSVDTELLPWHKEISQGLQRLQSTSTSMAELAWAQAANRLIEKAGDEAETIENGSFMIQARRRLILTSQMIQQLFPAVFAPMVKVEANSAHESVIYHVAKSTLSDACSLISLFGIDSCVEDVNL